MLATKVERGAVMLAVLSRMSRSPRVREDALLYTLRADYRAFGDSFAIGPSRTGIFSVFA